MDYFNSYSEQKEFSSFDFSAIELKLNPRLYLFSSKIDLSIESARYNLRTANTAHELLSLFKLRRDVFSAEYGILLHEEYDYESYDFHCDHLIIEDKETKKIVGTYRLGHTSFQDNFYAASEFNIDYVLELEGHKLELGRACTDPAHRNGHVVDLLWRGIAQYSALSHSSYIFGVSSVKSGCHQSISNLSAYFDQMSARSEYFSGIKDSIKPNANYSVEIPRPSNDLELVNHSKVLIPPLLRSYLLANSDVAPTPAYDREFNCFDFFMILEVKNVSSSFKKRYFLK